MENNTTTPSAFIFCHKCGTQLPGDAAFCVKCGQPVFTAPAAAPLNPQFTDNDVITFPDPAFESAVREAIGKPTGDITKSDVARVTELNVGLSNIKDLTGIEHFTALTELQCGGNQLTALDVTHNTALTGLYCGGNQLTTLDVTRNTALTRLICDHNYFPDKSAIIGLDESKPIIFTFIPQNSR
jgi:Leucine-rich repeat (LRR) protein